MKGLKEIREARQKPALQEVARYQQEHIAKMLGVTVQTYRSYERNPSQMQLHTALKLADYLQCDVADFYLPKKGN